MTIEDLLEKIRLDVMGIIGSCESPDNANAYDMGHRDGVTEVRITVESYFNHLPHELSGVLSR
jgi:hypothetical protein